MEPNKKEIIKPITNAPCYFISNFGNLYSTKSGEMKQLKVNVDSRNLYLLTPELRLVDGTYKKFLVHRLVAAEFIDNPNCLPEVNHKDKNTKNNDVSNLEWCDRRKNLEDSYLTMSPVRNFSRCVLVFKNEKIGEFQSISEAAKFAHEKFNVSKSSLSKYLSSGEYAIIPYEQKGKYDYPNKTKRINNKNPIILYYNGEYIETFKSFSKLTKYLNDFYDISLNTDSLTHRFTNHEAVEYGKVKITRKL